MRRVFENSVKTPHSTSIARLCDGGVSELFRSCFCALAMFSRQRRENIASVPAGLFSPYGLKTHGLQVRFAHPSNFAPGGQSPPGVPAGLLALWAKRTASRSAGADHSKCAPGGHGPPGVPHGLFSPCGLKTHMLQVRFAHPPNCALALGLPPTAGTPELVFRPAYWPVGPNARPPGPLARTLRTAPRAGAARPGFRMAYFRPAGSKRTCSRFASLTLRNAPRAGKARPGFRPAYWSVGPNARPSGPLKRTLRTAPRAGTARPGVPHGFQARAGWARVLVRRGC